MRDLVGLQAVVAAHTRDVTATITGMLEAQWAEFLVEQKTVSTTTTNKLSGTGGEGVVQVLERESERARKIHFFSLVWGYVCS